MDIARRDNANPILTPADVPPSLPGVEVACLLNPGAFEFAGRTYLLMRVCERPPQREGFVSTIFHDVDAPGGFRTAEFALDDPKLKYDDSRVFFYDGVFYLTTLSHLRPVVSDDGVHFTVLDEPLLRSEGPLERYGVEDVRVTPLGEEYVLTYTAVSELGAGAACMTTRDWKTFRRRGMIFPPPNKDVTFFPEKIGGRFVALHRPDSGLPRGCHIWCAKSEDGDNWSGHRCIAQSRPGRWDSARIGAGAAPIRTDKGWLEIYHGADENNRYCLGALLLDLQRPWEVLARSEEPIMTPEAPYEREGFFGNVIFTNGQIVRGDAVRLYYGASDSVICAADLSIAEILASLDD